MQESAEQPARGGESAGTSGRRIRPSVLRMAELLDTKYRIPGTGIRFGLDPIIGLIPGIGDTITMLMGLVLVFEARRIGLGRGVIAQMLLNLGLDWLVGLIPGLDIIFDTAFKAHARNARLLREAVAARGG